MAHIWGALYQSCDIGAASYVISRLLIRHCELLLPHFLKTRLVH